MWEEGVEFAKNVFADFILRLMKTTGGYDSGMKVVGRCSHVWKNGKPTRGNGLRKAEELRMPAWHHHMINWMAEERWKRRILEMKPGTRVYRKVGGRKVLVYRKPKAIEAGGQLILNHPMPKHAVRRNGLPLACPDIP